MATKKKSGDLVDDILNGTSTKSKNKSSKKIEPKTKSEPEIVHEQVVEAEPIEYTEPVEPVAEKIQEIETNPQKENESIEPETEQKSHLKGRRVVLKELAGRTVHGSVGHDLIFDIKLDDNGVSEPIQDVRIVEKLLKCGYKILTD